MLNPKAETQDLKELKSYTELQMATEGIVLGRRKQEPACANAKSRQPCRRSPRADYAPRTCSATPLRRR